MLERYPVLFHFPISLSLSFQYCATLYVVVMVMPILKLYRHDLSFYIANSFSS